MTCMKTQRSRKANRENLDLAKLFEIHNRSNGKSPMSIASRVWATVAN